MNLSFIWDRKTEDIFLMLLHYFTRLLQIYIYIYINYMVILQIQHMVFFVQITADTVMLYILVSRKFQGSTAFSYQVLNFCSDLRNICQKLLHICLLAFCNMFNESHAVASYSVILCVNCIYSYTSWLYLSLCMKTFSWEFIVEQPCISFW